MEIETATIRRLRDALLQSGRRPGTVMSSAYETLTREGLLSPEETETLQRIDPLAETMFLMMAADGKVEETERDAIRGAIRGLTDSLIQSGTIDVMLENFQKQLDESSRDERLRAIAEKLGEDKEQGEGAFALAAAIALADDDVAEEENALIHQIAEWFGISEERAHQILDQLEDDRSDGT